VANRGAGYPPGGGAICSGLSGGGNLTLPPGIGEGGLSVDGIFEMFPNLKERRKTAQGTKLSGGEQQMLAMARILRTGAHLLLLDEITEGLAPVIVQALGPVILKLKERGFTNVPRGQNFRFPAPHHGICPAQSPFLPGGAPTVGDLG